MAKFAMFVLCVFLAGCASVPDENSNLREFTWHRARTADEAKEVCLRLTGESSISCLSYKNNICHIVSLDTDKQLLNLGRQVQKCYREYPGLTRGVSLASRAVILVPMPIDRLQGVCESDNIFLTGQRERGRLTVGCHHDFRTVHYVYVPSDAGKYRKYISEERETHSLGHEFKHVFQGLWHDMTPSRSPKPGVFIGVD